jgi:hypothetical protein
MADTTNSLLKTAIERIRGYLDDPDLEAKYSDDYVIRHVIQPAFASVLSRVKNSASNPVLQRLSLPLVQGQQYYQLPPCVGEVWRIAILDTSGIVVQEAIPRGMYNLRGQNWMLEGNLISFMPYPDANYSEVEVWYCPSGDYQPFFCATPGAGAVLNANKDQVTFTLSTLTTAGITGSIDRRPSAYVGQMLRLLNSATNGIIEERMIASWLPNTGVPGQWIATLRRPFTYAAAGNLSSFEIAPEGTESLYEAVAIAGAMKLAGYRKISGEHFGMIQAQYRDAMKTLMDQYSNMQMRMPKAFEKDTVDNQLGQAWRI